MKFIHNADYVRYNGGTDVPKFGENVMIDVIVPSSGIAAFVKAALSVPDKALAEVMKDTNDRRTTSDSPPSNREVSTI